MSADYYRYLGLAEKRRNKIRALHGTGKSIEWLARKFGVSKPRIHQIINSKRTGK